MITAYYRPQSLDEAINLLMSQPEAMPIGGGTTLERFTHREMKIVDLQALKLDQVMEQTTVSIRVGATCTYAQSADILKIFPSVKSAITCEAGLNQQNRATLGGIVVSGDGRSPLLTALLALDVALIWQPDDQRISIGDWLVTRRLEKPGCLMTSVEINTLSKFAMTWVGRSPFDRPLLVVAVTKWGSGRCRVAVGGFGDTPLLAMDGFGQEGVEKAVANACYDSGDAWASAEYRQAVAGKLALRCLAEIDAESEG